MGPVMTKFNPIWTGGGVAATPTLVYHTIKMKGKKMEGCSFVTLSFDILDISPSITDGLGHLCGEIIHFCQHLSLQSLLFIYDIGSQLYDQ